MVVRVCWLKMYRDYFHSNPIPLRGVVDKKEYRDYFNLNPI